MKLYKLEIVDYNPEWRKIFIELESKFLKFFGDNILNVEHVGSTSIPGLKAKPVIDVDIIIKDSTSIKVQVIKKLKHLGYNHLGNLGISGREAFKLLNSQLSNFPKHNLYLCRKNSIGLKNHILFRNYLRNNPKKMLEYSLLKEKLIEKFPNDFDSYCSGKTEFITGILTLAGLNKKEVELIKKENQI